MVELNRNQFRRKDPMSPIKDNMGTIITAIFVVLCILASMKMQKGSAPQRIQAQQGVVLDMAPTRSNGSPRRGADPIAQKRSSLEVRPVWGNLPGLEQPETPQEPEPEPEPEPEVEPIVAAPAMPTYEQPDLSDLMKGVQKAAPKMKKSTFGSSTKGGSSGGGGGFQRVTSFEDQERTERAAREKERKAAGPPIGGNAAQREAARRRLKKAIEMGGSPEAIQKHGIDIPTLYQLQNSGVNMDQFVGADGSLNISDEAAASMASQAGLMNSGPDKKTSDSQIRPGM